MDIATRRLRNQRLAGNPLGSADEVVGWLGAVQAQDYPAAVWALGQRTRDATDADVHRLFDAGTIVRTWLLALTAPRLRTAITGLASPRPRTSRAPVAPRRCACRCACSIRSAPMSGPPWSAPPTG
jgi:hypothetical protein